MIRVLVIGLVLALVGCRGVGNAGCQSGSCPSGQVCDQATQLCIKAAPVQPGIQIQIDQPSEGETLSGDITPLVGSVTEADGSITSAEYSFDDAGAWTPLDLDGSGAFNVNIPLPTENAAPVQITVRATDAKGTQKLDSVDGIVDNVAPTASVSAADNSRANELTLKVRFDEPVLPETSTPVLLISPDAGTGAWSADRTTYSVQLTPDTVYTAQVQASSVRDSANNKNPASPQITFRTRPIGPASGTVIDPPAGYGFTAFDAKSDSDGVTALAAAVTYTSNDVKIFWGSFDPKTGGFVSHELDSPGQVSSIRALAHVGAAPDARRIYGAIVDLTLEDGGTLSQAVWQQEGSAPVSKLEDVLAMVPTDPGCAEPGGPVGLAVTDAGTPFYVRTGQSLVPLPFSPRWTLAQSGDEWEWLATEGKTLVRQKYFCDCTAGTCGFVPDSGTTVVYSPVDNATSISAARTVLDRRLLVFQSNGAQYERCEACLDSDAGTCPTTVNQLDSSSNNLRVASMNQDGWVIGSRFPAGQTNGFELVKRDLGSSCDSTWAVLGAIPDAGTTNFVPVMFGPNPGVLYLDTDQTIRVFVP